MTLAVGLMDGLGLDSDRCIRMIPRQSQQSSCNKLVEVARSRLGEKLNVVKVSV